MLKAAVEACSCRYMPASIGNFPKWHLENKCTKDLCANFSRIVAQIRQAIQQPTCLAPNCCFEWALQCLLLRAIASLEFEGERHSANRADPRGKLWLTRLENVEAHKEMRRLAWPPRVTPVKNTWHLLWYCTMCDVMIMWCVLMCEMCAAFLED